MARRMWILVEWVDEKSRNIFPSYGVVNTDLLAYKEADLSPGSQISISFRRENPPRRGKILRLSASKRFLQEQKEILEKQDKKMNNVFQLCMKTIKEMKAEAMSLSSPLINPPSISSQNAIPHITANRDSTSDSESETNSHPDISRAVQLNNGVKYQPYGGTEVNRTCRSSHRSFDNHRRSIKSSTPKPLTSAQDSIKLCIDQASQTDDTLLQPRMKTIEEMELELKSLQQRFNKVVTELNTTTDAIYLCQAKRNGVDVSFNESTVNEHWTEHDNSTETVRVGDQNVYNEEPEVVGEDAPNNGSNIKTEGENNNANTLRVRRVSAQTTNNIEHNAFEDSDMIPIGNSNAMIPARLLNEMDWNSHTSVTRALLQAIFPRKVLATHSLTGKQSPAFANKPPKKILDPLIVDDIVKIVSTRCGVPNNLVRNSITIKCTDEAKLYRNRQHRHARQLSTQNEANIQPSIPSSDEMSVITNSQ